MSVRPRAHHKSLFSRALIIFCHSRFSSPLWVDASWLSMAIDFGSSSWLCRLKFKDWKASQL
jgi:hypothetical protein